MYRSEVSFKYKIDLYMQVFVREKRSFACTMLLVGVACLGSQRALAWRFCCMVALMFITFRSAPVVENVN
jgi:hypothetical protein